MLTRRKKIIFSLLPALALLALCALVEVGLRIFSPSLATPLASPVTADGVEWLEINRRCLAKYFPSDIVFLPEFKPTLFRKHKAPGSFRVFCLGESSMFGTPYQMNATIPAIVRTQLRHLAPGKEIEVINLGASAINSGVLADIAPQVADFAPDIVMIYTGHNEFYGPGGVGATWLEKRIPVLTRLRYALLNLRLSSLARKAFGGGGPEKGGNLMKDVSRGQEVALGSPDAERVFSLFEAHLREILDTFRARGIPVIISDISSNLRFPPFISPPLREIPDCADAFAREGPALLPRLLALRSAHPENAALAYWAGRCYEARGVMDSARTLMVEARDEDLLKFRAPRRTNDIIRRVALETSTPFVSTDSLFVALSPGGIPGENLFWEHLHPNARGYYEIAGLFIDKIGPFFPPANSPTGHRAPFDVDSLAIPWLDLAYADIAMQHLTTRWPFDRYRIAQRVMPGAPPELASIASDVYTHRMNWDEACYRSALVLEGLGRTGDALTTCRSLLEHYPRHSYAHYLEATIYKNMGQFGPAEVEYEASIGINPSYPIARVDLGLMLINAGRFDDAIAKLDASLALTGEKGSEVIRATALYGLAAAWANKGDYPGALRLIDESLALSPDYAPARALRDGLRRAARSSHP